MKRLDHTLAWIILGLGIVHCGITPIVYGRFTQSAVWFFGAGLAGIFVGMLNLIRIEHGRVVPAVRKFAVIANVLTLGWTIAGTASMLAVLHSNPQAVVLVAALAGETALSLRGPRS